MFLKVEDVIRQKIEDQWQDFSRAIVLKDQDGTGRLYPKELRRIVEKFCIPMSNEHFERSAVNLFGSTIIVNCLFIFLCCWSMCINICYNLNVQLSCH